MSINLPLGCLWTDLVAHVGLRPSFFLKDPASLPNQDFRLRGLNNNFDVDGVLEGEVKSKGEQGGTMA